MTEKELDIAIKKLLEERPNQYKNSKKKYFKNKKAKKRHIEKILLRGDGYYLIEKLEKENHDGRYDKKINWMYQVQDISHWFDKVYIDKKARKIFKEDLAKFRNGYIDIDEFLLTDKDVVTWVY